MGQPRPVRVQSHGLSVKDELVVAANLVHVNEGLAVILDVIVEEVVADLFLAHLEGRGRNVEHQGGPLLGQLFYGVGGVQAAAPEVRVAPGVLADGNPQHFVLEGHGVHFPGRVEVPGFVEDVVRGQQGFVLLKQDLAPINQDGAVVKALAGVAAGGPGGPH